MSPIDCKFLVSHPAARGGEAARPFLLSCGSMTEYSIGVDLGGTNLRAAAVSREGKMLGKIAGRSELQAGRDAVLLDIVSAIKRLIDQNTDRKLVGVGMGVPGFIRFEEGVIVGSNNLPDFEDFPIRDELERLLGEKLILENDANAAALGEKWIGAGRDVDDLVMLTLGTGIGGGIISHGKILRGYLGMAGEIGHITVMADGNPCGCGNRGCLEKHASATAIVAMAKLLHLGDGITSEGVYKLAVEGNERALMIFTAVGEALGIALAGLINLFNYPLYLLSGGPLPAWDLFAPPMMHEVQKRSYTFREAKTRIEKAALGNEAGLYGAAYLPFQAQEDAKH
jgi:glucokinase